MKKREGGGKGLRPFLPLIKPNYVFWAALLQMHAAVDGNVFAGDVAPGF